MNITVHKNGQQRGPYSEEQVGGMLHSGQLAPEDLAWTEGMSEWKPLSSFARLPSSFTQAPPPLPENTASSAPKTKTEPLSIWALVLGIVSFVGCTVGGFLAGIPAVICGHLGLSRIKRNPALGGRGMAIAGLATGYFSILVLPLFLLAALSLPAITGALARGQATQMLSNMKQVHLAVLQAQLDGTTTGNSKIGFPATANLRSKAELKQMLVSEGYLTAESLDRLKFDEMEVANISDDDPADTLFLRATSPNGKLVIVFRKSGDGAIYKAGQDSFSADPPRNPAFLD